MSAAFARLEEVLDARCAGGPVTYFANPGNWGDAVIRHGTLEFFRDVGLDFQEIRSWNEMTASRPGGTIIYGGGGGWCRLWSHARGYVAELSKSHPVIVLPSTYELGCTIPGATFFRRDRFGSKKTMPGAVFCHDMAFYLENRIASGGRGRGRGYFLRVDAESARQISLPPGNDDISYRGGHLLDPAPFYAAIDRFSEIHTDRLHVAIVACLLGKELHMYPGSYFKNRDVYRSSIEGRFTNTTFHDEIAAIARGQGDRQAEIVFQLSQGYEVSAQQERVVVRNLETDHAVDLNSTAALIVRLMDGRRSTAEIRWLLQESYPESAAEIAIDVERTIATLLRGGTIRASLNTDL